MLLLYTQPIMYCYHVLSTIALSLSLYIYTYIYIYINRERERQFIDVIPYGYLTYVLDGLFTDD